MAVAAVLAQRGARLPGLAEPAGSQRGRNVGPERPVRTRHDPPGPVATRHRPAQQRQGGEEGGAGLDAAHLAERLRRRDGPHTAQGLGCHGLPATGHGPGHHVRVEVEERRGHRPGADSAEGGGPGGEVALPEAPQPRLTQRGGIPMRSR